MGIPKIKKIIVILIIGVFLNLLFMGCLENQSSNYNPSNLKIISSSLDKFILPLNSFEEGYQYKFREPEMNLLINLNSENYICLDYYFNDPNNDTGYPWIGFEIYKLSSNSKASLLISDLNDYKQELYDESKSIPIAKDVTIGNESYFGYFDNVTGLYYKTNEAMICFIFFKIYNIGVYLFVEGISVDDSNYFDRLLNLAEDIENKIEEESMKSQEEK